LQTALESVCFTYNKIGGDNLSTRLIQESEMTERVRRSGAYQAMLVGLLSLNFGPSSNLISG
jgi:hypothetical protein